MPKSYIRSLPVRDRISAVQPLGLDIINLGFNELPFKPTEKVSLAIEKIRNVRVKDAPTEKHEFLQEPF